MPYTDPSDGGTLDLANGTVVTETHWDNMRRDLLYLGGTTGQITKVALDYTEATDLFNGTAVLANSTTTLLAAQAFTVDNATSDIEIHVSMGGSLTDTSGSAGAVRLDAYVDGATTRKLSIGFHIASGSAPFSGGTARITGLTAGAHTVAVRMLSQTAGLMYLRCATNTYEHISVRVFERKR